MKYVRNNPELKQRRRDLRYNQTDAEKVLWKHIRNRQFFGLRFLRQYSVGPYIMDFYCPKLKLAIELDGGQHNQVDKKKYDEGRAAFLKEYGVEVLRFWNHDIMRRTQSVLDKLMTIVNPMISPSLGKRNEG
jgi:very-short-patch-repair endonuclease